MAKELSQNVCCDNGGCTSGGDAGTATGRHRIEVGGARHTGRRSMIVACLAVAVVGIIVVNAGARDERVAAAADVCLGSTDPTALSQLFTDEPGGIIAADYQRAVPLPDGRTLWLFQDAIIRLPPPPPPPPTTSTTTTTIPGEPPPPPEPPPPTERLLHNIGMLQTGTCFEVLRTGTAADPGPWLFADETTMFGQWFWPLGAEMGGDGTLYVFVAEMLERGAVYLTRAEPVSTRIVGIDVSTMHVVFQGRPPNSGASLYGFSVASDASWTYLYAQCHRQFGWDIGPFGVGAHDESCAGAVTVARVPKGQLFDVPNYWDGITWQPSPTGAAAVMPTEGRRINPSQIRWDGNQFVAVTKADDWFGSTIHLDRAEHAAGPWTTYARLRATPKCSPRVCNTYFASWIPSAENGLSDRFVIGLSHNRWDGRLSVVNRPSFLDVPAPDRYPLATRCELIDC